MIEELARHYRVVVTTATSDQLKTLYNNLDTFVDPSDVTLRPWFSSCIRRYDDVQLMSFLCHDYVDLLSIRSMFDVFNPFSELSLKRFRRLPFSFGSIVEMNFTTKDVDEDRRNHVMERCFYGMTMMLYKVPLRLLIRPEYYNQHVIRQCEQLRRSYWKEHDTAVK